jgi:hypothetical protein
MAGEASQRELLSPTYVFMLALAVGGTLRAGWALMSPMDQDVGVFYASARAWWDGAPLYSGHVYANLNPPLFVLLWTPLALIPVSVAVWIWTGLGAVSLGLTLREMKRGLRWDRGTVIRVLIGLLATLPAQIAWAEGQVTWVLLYPLTKAWRFAREGRSVMAGAWLAPAIAVKPILALTPLVLGFPILVTAGALSAALTLIGMAVTGPQPWHDWLATTGTVTWISRPDNVAVWGLLARSLGASFYASYRITDFPAWAVLMGMGAGGAVAYMATRADDLDRRWVLAGLFTIALSPLGWLYYLPLFLAPFMAVLHRPHASNWLRAGFALLLIPMQAIAPAVGHPLAYAIVGSVYSVAVLCFIIGVNRDAAEQPNLAD